MRIAFRLSLKAGFLAKYRAKASCGVGFESCDKSLDAKMGGGQNRLNFVIFYVNLAKLR